MFFVSTILLIIGLSLYSIMVTQNRQANNEILQQALGMGNPVNQSLLNNYSILSAEVNLNFGSVNIRFNNWSQSEQAIIEMVHEAVSLQEPQGIMPNYNVQYATYETPFTKTIAFIDLEMMQISQKIIVINSLLILGGLWIVSFGLVYLLSNKVVKPIEKSFKQQQELVSNLSHELRNPLAIISANTDILNSQQPSSWLEQIGHQSERMGELIDQMLYLSQSDEAKNNIQKETLNFSELIWEIVLPMQSLAHERKISLTFDIEDDLIVVGDAIRLKQVISILCDNALKYNIEPHTIHIIGKSYNHDIQLIVENSGPSIDSQELKHIFDRFYRSDKVRNSFSGSYGLGLSMAQTIINQHHGSISATSKNNTNRFIVKLSRK